VAVIKRTKAFRDCHRRPKAISEEWSSHYAVHALGKKDRGLHPAHYADIALRSRLVL